MIREKNRREFLLKCGGFGLLTTWSAELFAGSGRLGQRPAGTRRRLELTLQRRGPSNAVTSSRLTVDAAQTAVVVVDMWRAHYCPGANAVAKELVPAMNRALDAARRLGIPVVFASAGDDLKRWEGKPQRLRITGLPRHDMPPSNDFLKEQNGYGPYPASCMCKVTALKPGTNEPLLQCKRIPLNHNQSPDVIVGDQDVFIAAGHYRPEVKWALYSWGEAAQQELWNFVQERGITHLLYMGVSANMCVLNREFSMIMMKRLGLESVLVRDLTRAMTFDGYSPITLGLDPAFTPALGTLYAVEYIEREVGPSIVSEQLLRAASHVKPR